MSDMPQISIPDAKTLKKEAGVELLPSYVELPPNLAENSTLCEKYHGLAYDFFESFRDQSLRTELIDMLAAADRAWRLSTNKTTVLQKASAQQQDTLSDVTSPEYYSAVRLLTAAQTSILFQDGSNLPAEYTPLSNTNDYSEVQGDTISRNDNLLLNYNWAVDKWDDKIRDIVMYSNKNAHEFITLEWEKLTKMIVARSPGYYQADGTPVAVNEQTPEPAIGEAYGANGNMLESVFNGEGEPLSYVRAEKENVIKDCATLKRHDLKNVFIDLSIDDMQQQSCIVIRSQESLTNIMSKYQSGEYMNVDRLCDSQLYDGDDRYGLEIEDNEDDNVSIESITRNKNGLFDVFHVFMMAPIDSTGKGKWDDKKVIPEIYEAKFIGPFDEFGNSDRDSDGKSKGCVCVKLRRNPYHNRKYPCHLQHSHIDDRGAVHIGNITLLAGLVEEMTTTMNQHIDNKTLINKAPFIGEKGNVISRDLTSGANKVIWVKPGSAGTALTRQNIPDTTNSTVPLMQFLKKQFDDTIGTGEAMRGEFAGSRTSANEYLGAKEMQLKPLLEQTRRFASELFSWMLEQHADLWRQFGDPTKKITITGDDNSIIGEADPGALYGKMFVKVNAVDKFEKNLAQRQTLVNFISSGGYTQSKEFMGKEGALYFWRAVGESLELPDVEKIFPEAQRYVEAENQAMSDIKGIMRDPQASMSDPEMIPQEGERHDVHVKILEDYLERFQLIAKVEPENAQYNQAVMSALQLYITIHQQYQQQAAMAMQQQQAQAPAYQGQQPAENQGEQSGEFLAGATAEQTR